MSHYFGVQNNFWFFAGKRQAFVLIKGNRLLLKMYGVIFPTKKNILFISALLRGVHSTQGFIIHMYNTIS